MNADTAFISLLHFRGIVFKSLQRSNLAFEDHYIVPQQPDFRAARDLSFGDIATGNDANLWQPERVSNFCATQMGFSEYGIEHAKHGAFDFVDHVVNDRGESDVDFLTVCQLRSFSFRSDVKADDDGV